MIMIVASLAIDSQTSIALCCLFRAPTVKNCHTYCHALCCRVPKLINFPEFEEQYEIFESLGSLHVSVQMQPKGKKAAWSQLLLTGLQLPVLAKRRGGSGSAASDATVAPGDESDDGEEQSGDGLPSGGTLSGDESDEGSA